MLLCDVRIQTDQCLRWMWMCIFGFGCEILSQQIILEKEYRKTQLDAVIWHVSSSHCRIPVSSLDSPSITHFSLLRWYFRWTSCHQCAVRSRMWMRAKCNTKTVCSTAYGVGMPFFSFASIENERTQFNLQLYIQIFFNNNHNHI